MRIDLPQCNLKTCRYCFDGNCTNKVKYEICEYAFLRKVGYEICKYISTHRKNNKQYEYECVTEFENGSTLWLEPITDELDGFVIRDSKQNTLFEIF